VIDLINNIIYLPKNERFLANSLMGFMPLLLLNIEQNGGGELAEWDFPWFPSRLS
jgi:hypothetical protein